MTACDLSINAAVIIKEPRRLVNICVVLRLFKYLKVSSTCDTRAVFYTPLSNSLKPV